jgi:hypothetical protein
MGKEDVFKKAVGQSAKGKRNIEERLIVIIEKDIHKK